MKKIVSVTADGSHEDKGQNKEVRSLLPQKYTDDITATSILKIIHWIPMMTKNMILPKYQLSTTDDE